MKKQINSLALKLSISIYGLIYLNGFIAPLFGESLEQLETTMPIVEIYTVPLAFLIFLIGVIYTWFNEKVGGIILLVWHFIVWFFSMYLWKEAGMILILIFPVLYLSVFLILNWYKCRIKKYSQSINQWKLVLNILMINYAAIYLLIVVAEVIERQFGIILRQNTVVSIWDYNTMESIILVVLFLVFSASYFSIYKSRLVSGTLLILWYVLLIYLGLTSFKFANSGPWNVFSLPILVQGILYIILHFKEKRTLAE